MEVAKIFYRFGLILSIFSFVLYNHKLVSGIKVAMWMSYFLLKSAVEFLILEYILRV